MRCCRKRRIVALHEFDPRTQHPPAMDLRAPWRNAISDMPLAFPDRVPSAGGYAPHAHMRQTTPLDKEKLQETSSRER